MVHLEHTSEAVRFLKGNVQAVIEQGFVLLLNDNFDCHFAVELPGDLDHVDFPLQEIADRAHLVSATKILLAHTHPTGTVSPSTDDIVCYIEARDFLKEEGLLLLDSIVMNASGNYTSIRAFTSSKVDLNDYIGALTPSRDKH